MGMGVLNNSREDMQGSGLLKMKRGFAEPECGQKRSQVGFSVLKSLGREDQVIIHACGGKQKRARASEQVTPELDAEQVFNAALALYELFSGVSSSLPVAVVSLKHVHGAWKRRRSSRSRKPDKLSDSSTTSSERQTVLDLFPSYNTPCIEVVQTGSAP